MRLVLIEAESGKTKETPLPISEKFTIGREGDIIPTIPSVQLLSRIHATVLPQDGTWRVIDGDGETPSRNGLWHNNERVQEFTIVDPEDFVDLLPFAESVMLVRVSGAETINYDRSTAGFEQHSIENLYEELEGIKAWQVQQTRRTEHIEQQLSEISEIKQLLGAVVEGQQRLAQDNDRQDGEIRRGHWLIKGVAIALLVVLAGAAIDKERQKQYIDVALSLIVSGGIGQAVLNAQKK